jgi:ribosomal protein L21E
VEPELIVHEYSGTAGILHNIRGRALKVKVWGDLQQNSKLDFAEAFETEK